jgi:hypothetical protein
MAGRTSFEFELGTASKRPRPDDESAMRILVLGDFSAHAQRGMEERRDRFQSIAQPEQALSGPWS